MKTSVDDRNRAKSWLRARLTEGERPREEWRALWAATWEELLRTPVDDLLDARSTGELVERLIETSFVVDAAGPLLAKVQRAAIDSLRRDATPLDRRMPAEARERLHRAVAKPGLVHPDWVRAVLRGEAIESILNETLYGVLKDFSTLIPRIMTRMPSIGRFSLIGGAGALAERLIREVEKLVEPEIRAFLADGTGRVLESAADFTVERIDDPIQLEFRATFVDFVLSRSPEFLLASLDESSIDELEQVAVETLRHLSEDDEARTLLRGWVERGIESCAGMSVGEVLEIDASEPSPPTDALADATWPAFRSLLEGPHARDWLDSLVDELLDFVADT